MNKNILLATITIIFIILAGTGAFFLIQKEGKQPPNTNTPSGATSTSDTINPACILSFSTTSKNLIEINQPKPCQSITSPIEIKGKIKIGEKIIDNNILITITDENDHTLAQEVNKLTTENEQLFNIQVSYQKPSSKKGNIRLYVYVPKEGFVPSEGVLETWVPKTLVNIPVVFKDEIPTIPQDWKTFKDSHITFRYPNDWYVEEEYLYKNATNQTVIVCSQKEPELYCIAINMPQAPEYLKRTNIKNNWISANTSNEEITTIYEKLVSSFRVIE